jgi:hypothetical protein
MATPVTVVEPNIIFDRRASAKIWPIKTTVFLNEPNLPRAPRAPELDP